MSDELYINESASFLIALSATALGAIAAKKVKTEYDKKELQRIIRDYKTVHPDIIPVSECKLIPLTKNNIDELNFSDKEKSKLFDEHGCTGTIYTYKNKVMAKVVINNLPSGAGQLIINLESPVFKKYKDYYKFCIYHDQRNVIGGCFISTDDKQLMKKFKDEIKEISVKESANHMNFSEMINEICDSFIESSITEDQAELLLNGCIAKESGVSSFEEGANMQYRSEFKKAKKAFKAHLKVIKTLAKKGNPEDNDKIKKEISDAKAELKASLKTIQSIPSSTASAVLGWMVIGITDWIKWIIPIILTLGFAAIVPAMKQTIELLTGIQKGNNEEEAWADALNMLKRRYQITVQHMSQILDFLYHKYKENCKKKTVKESTDLKLEVYEAFEAGEITEEQRDLLLDRLNMEDD